MDVAVVYYSRKGTVEGLAGLIEKELRERGHSVTRVPIRTRKRPWYLTAGRLSIKEAEVEFINDPKDLDLTSYDTILLGGPIFAGKVNPWTRTFIARARGLEGKPGGVFIACGAKVTKAGGYIEEMANLAGRRGLVVRGRLVGSTKVRRRYPELARSFVDEVMASTTDRGESQPRGLKFTP